MLASGGPVRCPAPGEPDEDAPVVAFAVCLDCGANIAGWRERLLPVDAGTLAVTERGDLAIQVVRQGACPECGGGRAQIRIEARHLPYV
jgi:hypothetical protein